MNLEITDNLIEYLKNNEIKYERNKDSFLIHLKDSYINMQVLHSKNVILVTFETPETSLNFAGSHVSFNKRDGINFEIGIYDKGCYNCIVIHPYDI